MVRPPVVEQMRLNQQDMDSMLRLKEACQALHVAKREAKGSFKNAIKLKLARFALELDFQGLLPKATQR